MSSAVTYRIIGLEATLAKAKLLLDVVTSEDAQAITMYAARRVAAEAKKQAPRAKIAFNRLRGPSTKPGQLRDSIVARGVKRAKLLERGPAAFVLPLIRVGPQSKRAPHAAFVAFGTRERVTKKPGGVMAFPAANGGMIFTRRARGTTANPYMDRAIAIAGPAAIDELSKKFDELIAQRMRER